MAVETDGVVLPSGTVTFLFTDIEGSTPLWDRNPDGMRVALSRHDEILRSAIEAAEGYVFSTGGDGFGVAFSSAANALDAALDAQRRLSAEAWPDGSAIRVRMGIHTGETDERDGDYFGPPVNRAARLMGAAHGGQIVLSALTAGVVGDGSDIDLIDLGPCRLKGLVDPVHVFGVSADGHDWLDKALVSTQSTAGNLPRLQTETVGDLADVQRRIAGLANTQMVTLTGSGGVGKTRAAIEIGWLVVDEFVDGVWLFELAAVADPHAVAASIASTLGIYPEPGATITESIVDWCRGRRMLLIVDNCEHVLEPAIELISTVVASCPTVTVLATSREPLGVAGEQVTRIASLAADAARELFVIRARAADSTFVPSPADGEAIESICERLDGIPLAIELAAARIRSLSPVDLLGRIDDRFRLLRGAGRGGLERHQTLRATVNWSYQLLSESERLLFDRISVFAGSFDVDAAESVCAGQGIDDLDVIDLLGDLVDKSMLLADRGDLGTRYRLLETLRQYGEERLDDRGETAALRDAHLRHYTGVAITVHHRWLSTDQPAANTAFGLEWQNLRAAFGWSVTIQDGSAAIALTRAVRTYAWSIRRTEVGDWAQRARIMLEQDALCPSELYGSCVLWEFMDGDLERAVATARNGLEMDDDANGIGLCRIWMFYSLGALGRTDDRDQMLPSLQQTVSSDADIEVRWWAANSVSQLLIGHPAGSAVQTDLEALTREIGAPVLLAESTRIRGMHTLFDHTTPDANAALAYYRAALEQNQTAGTDTSWAEMTLAHGMVHTGHDGADAAIRDLITNTYEVRNWVANYVGLELAARVLIEAASHVEATTLYGHLELQPAPWGDLGTAFRSESLNMLAPLDNAETLRSAGAALGRHELVAYTLAALDAQITS
jgi:predicted ATPase/class 3 adenylate cyclase